MYLTLEEARELGATGDDTAVTSTILGAQVLVDSYCRQGFEPETATVAVSLDDTGAGVLPRRIVDVTTVVDRATGNTLDSAAYTWTTSAVVGDLDEIRLGRSNSFGASILINGAEPWNGGYAGHGSRTGVARRLLVTGVFGFDPIPVAVTAATATLVADAVTAAAGGGALLPGGLRGVQSFAVEGLSVTLAPDATEGWSTGSPLADRLLLPFRIPAPSGIY